ncbi:MAG: D-alanine--D-alanine ligase [Salibacteraceae bacterium]
MKKQKNIAIVAGGGSSEHGVSMKSAAVVDCNLKDAFNTFVIEMTVSNWIYHQNSISYEIDKNDFSLNIDGKVIRFDFVFIAIHGTPGEDGKLQGYFDMINMPYSSSNLLASSLSFNKGVCNDYLKNHGINVAKSIQLFEGFKYDADEIVSNLGLPCFVKSNQSGSSYGVNKVYSKDQLPAAIEDSFKYDKQVLIESFLDGREVTCGVTNFDHKITALPITEIITDNDFFDFEAKYKGESKEITPANLDPAIKKKVENAAKKVFQILNLNGVARVDFIIQDNEPFMIEANTVPGISAQSIIPQQAVAAGYTLPEFFQKWVNHGLK